MTTQTRTDIVRLNEPAATERSVVGAKAAHLATLRAAGFPVPDGAVLPASLLAGWRSGAAPPPEVERCVKEIVDSFPGAALAVRSSADAEDGTSASFAGTYATVLGATGVEEVTKAVRTCLDSADAPRLDAYRGAGGVRMSVLCQPMLDPDAAGVAFTADPVSGDHRGHAPLGGPRPWRSTRRRWGHPRRMARRGRGGGDDSDRCRGGHLGRPSAGRRRPGPGRRRALRGSAGCRVGHPRRPGAPAPEPADLCVARSPRGSARRSGLGEGRGSLPGAGHPVRMVGVRTGVRCGRASHEQRLRPHAGRARPGVHRWRGLRPSRSAVRVS